jgi:outer membrane receptor protein involved in Fe transport
VRALALVLAGGCLAPLAALSQEAEPPAEPLDSVPVQVSEEEAPVAADAARLDDVVVTAQKKPQKEIDVPVSVSVLYDDFISAWGITNVREAMLYVPNVKVEQAGFFSAPRIRGFSINNNNKAIEPPAGIVLDGIPYGRVEYFGAAVFDIDRIEVLRGPQGTTFGKNTTAGLIHLLTKNPPAGNEGYLDVHYGDYERRRIEGAFGGPVPFLDDFVNFRIAGLSNEMQGFVENTTAALSPLAVPYMRGDQNSGYRAKLEFPDLLGSTLRVGYESVELVSLGTGAELLRTGPNVQTVLLKYDPNTDFIPGNRIASEDYTDDRHTTIDTASGEWSLPLGDWSVVAVGGHSVMNTAINIDVDFSPSSANWATSRDTSPTETLELRTVSPQFEGLFGLSDVLGWNFGRSEFLIGAFYQSTGIEDSALRFVFPHAQYSELLAAANADANNDSSFSPETIRSGLPPGFVPDDSADDVEQFFESSSDTVALFGQVQWNFIPRWMLQVGGRYSQEDKQAHWLQRFNSPPPNALLQAAGLDEFEAARTREEKEFQPKVALNYQPWDDISLFVHWAEAYKGGGFNAFAFRGEEDQLTYGPEFSTEWGFDAKTLLFDRTVRLNVSLYRQDIDDFQVLTREPQEATAGDPATGEPPRPATVGLGISKVVNAAKARAQGVEADLTWLAASWLRVMGTLGLNDTEYLDFPINDCPADAPNSDGDDDSRCDASGRPFAYAPKWNGTLTPMLTSPFDVFGLHFSLAATAEYLSWQYVDIDLDERKVQDGFWRYRASFGVGDAARGWSFKVIGENLTDEVTYIRQGDVFAGVFVGAVEPPRQIFGQLRWTF